MPICAHESEAALMIMQANMFIWRRGKLVRPNMFIRQTDKAYMASMDAHLDGHYICQECHKSTKFNSVNTPCAKREHKSDADS
jgi:hypothetical protein